MKIGEKVDSTIDATVCDLEDMGWAVVLIYDEKDYINGEHIDWMKDNLIDVDNEVRWLADLAICFRRHEEAIAFKLRWMGE